MLIGKAENLRERINFDISFFNARSRDAACEFKENNPDWVFRGGSGDVWDEKEHWS